MTGMRSIIIWIALLALLHGILSPPAMAQAAGPNSELRGRVFAADGKTAVEGATVVAYHLSSEEVFESEPTNSKGQYTIPALPYGYYDLAVRTPDGLFVADQVANVPPSEKAEVSFSVKVYGATVTERRTFPADEDEDPTGIAAVNQKMVGSSFWRSPKGIGIAAGGGALLLLLIASGGDSNDAEPVASPSSP